MIIPPFLRKGDTIGLVAPAKKILPHTIDLAEERLGSWGLQVRRGRHLLSGSHAYFAGTDDQRLSDLQHFINDPGIHAILCARGAYGTTRIADQLNLHALIGRPKWIAGFSDITALHLLLFKAGIVSLHSTMPVNFEDPAYEGSTESLHRGLFGEATPITFHASANRPGTGRGRLIGGNLSLILDAMGTAREPDTRGSILVIEETDEYLHKVDRMLNQLQLSGKLDQLAGLLVGHMTRISNNDPPFSETIKDLVLHHTARKPYPIAFGFPTGHEAPNLAWYHGLISTLEVRGDSASLQFEWKS